MNTHMPLHHVLTKTMAGLLAALGAVYAAPVHAQLLADSGSNPSNWVYQSTSGNLVYRHDALGNRITDFSNVGYMGGGVPLPDVRSLVGPSRIVTVAPGSGDDSGRIQAAIDQVSGFSLAPNTGFRGVVQLQGGEYDIIDAQLRIAASGVVLRGSGRSGDNATILDIHRSDRWNQFSGVIEIGGSGSRRNTGGETAIIDKYVPSGARSFRIASSAGLSAGDRIIVEYDPNNQWFEDLGTHNLEQLGDRPNPPVTFSGNETSWTDGSGNYTFRFERTITRIEGNRIMLDTAIPQNIDSRYTTDSDPNRLRARVYTTDFPGRIENVGVEDLRGVSQFSGEEEDNAWTFINFDNTRNGFVARVAGEHLAYALVQTEDDASQITVNNARNIDPRSQVTGGRRYAFNIEGELTLMTRLESRNGRHDFVNNSNSNGPNVFLFAEAVNNNDSEAIGPHQRWSIGTLFDNVDAEGGRLAAWNRGGLGSGHAHSGAFMVFWNSSADEANVENPPTARNWAIGVEADFRNPNDFLGLPTGTTDSRNEHVTFNDPNNPNNSLYVAQLAERMQYADIDFREYVVGDFDRFEGGDTEDQLSIGANAQWIQATVDRWGTERLGEMDRREENHAVPISFEYELDDDEVVVAASLALALGGTGGGSTANDSLYFETFEDSGRISFAQLGIGEGRLPSDSSEVISIDFLALPGFSLADFNDGVFNLAVGEDTAVDWAQLQIRVASVPEPTGAMLIGALSLGLLGRPRRRP